MRVECSVAGIDFLESSANAYRTEVHALRIDEIDINQPIARAALGRLGSEGNVRAVETGLAVQVEELQLYAAVLGDEREIIRGEVALARGHRNYVAIHIAKDRSLAALGDVQ